MHPWQAIFQWVTCVSAFQDITPVFQAINTHILAQLGLLRMVAMAAHTTHVSNSIHEWNTDPEAKLLPEAWVRNPSAATLSTYLRSNHQELSDGSLGDAQSHGSLPFAFLPQSCVRLT
jgi:hypothetical protein